MRGLVLEDGTARFEDALAAPAPRADETLVRVVTAGVCATDLALARGYMDFEGVPGHEFVGVALDGPHAGHTVVGEINAACGTCPTCLAGDERHCPTRTVLGILGRPGAFAERLSLPTRNLHRVPAGLDTDEAVFAEPLAAAFEIAAQLDLTRFERALVVGDGRLGLLCAQVLAAEGVARVELFGHHPGRRALLAPGTEHRGDALDAALAAGERWPLVVEATGRPEVFARALSLVRPRGTLVLKTTAERPATIDLAPLVVDELTVVGSRCGAFGPALEALAAGRIAVRPLIQARYPLEEGAQALEHAARPGTLKVLIDVERKA